MVWFQVPVVLIATLSHLCTFPPNVFPNTSCCFSLFFPMVSSLLKMLGDWSSDFHPVGLFCKVPGGATSSSLSLTHPSTVFGCFLHILFSEMFTFLMLRLFSREKLIVFNVFNFVLCAEIWPLFPRAMGHP